MNFLFRLFNFVFIFVIISVLTIVFFSVSSSAQVLKNVLFEGKVYPDVLNNISSNNQFIISETSDDSKISFTHLMNFLDNSPNETFSIRSGDVKTTDFLRVHYFGARDDIDKNQGKIDPESFEIIREHWFIIDSLMPKVVVETSISNYSVSIYDSINVSIKIINVGENDAKNFHFQLDVPDGMSIEFLKNADYRKVKMQGNNMIYFDLDLYKKAPVEINYVLKSNKEVYYNHSPIMYYNFANKKINYDYDSKVVHFYSGIVKENEINQSLLYLGDFFEYKSILKNTLNQTQNSSFKIAFPKGFHVFFKGINSSNSVLIDKDVVDDLSTDKNTDSRVLKYKNSINNNIDKDNLQNVRFSKSYELYPVIVDSYGKNVISDDDLYIHNLNPSNYYYIFEFDDKLNPFENKEFNFLIQAKKTGFSNLTINYSTNINGFLESTSKKIPFVIIYENPIIQIYYNSTNILGNNNYLVVLQNLGLPKMIYDFNLSFESNFLDNVSIYNSYINLLSSTYEHVLYNLINDPINFNESDLVLHPYIYVNGSYKTPFNQIVCLERNISISGSNSGLIDTNKYIYSYSENEDDGVIDNSIMGFDSNTFIGKTIISIKNVSNPYIQKYLISDNPGAKNNLFIVPIIIILVFIVYLTINSWDLEKKDYKKLHIILKEEVLSLFDSIVNFFKNKFNKRKL
jgi:hypothetical protein